MNLLHYAAYAAFTLAFAQVAYTDQAKREINNWLTLTMFCCGLVFYISDVNGLYPWYARLAICLLLLAVGCFRWSRRQDASGGDVKLLPVLALACDPLRLLWLLMLALTLVGLTRLIKGKKDKYPLGSYLFLGWLLSLPLS